MSDIYLTRFQREARYWSADEYRRRLIESGQYVHARPHYETVDGAGLMQFINKPLPAYKPQDDWLGQLLNHGMTLLVKNLKAARRREHYGLANDNPGGQP